MDRTHDIEHVCKIWSHRQVRFRTARWRLGGGLDGATARNAYDGTHIGAHYGAMPTTARKSAQSAHYGAQRAHDGV
eukprot:jgi/Chrpa1/24385/Chrysochromulina_OHIO_Genome00026575-RA